LIDYVPANCPNILRELVLPDEAQPKAYVQAQCPNIFPASTNESVGVLPDEG
jgi:hypothetical protein